MRSVLIGPIDYVADDYDGKRRRRRMEMELNHYDDDETASTCIYRRCLETTHDDQR